MNIKLTFLVVLMFSLLTYADILFADPQINSQTLQLIQQKDGVMAMRRVRSWQDLIAQNKTKSIQQKLKLVNDFLID